MMIEVRDELDFQLHIESLLSQTESDDLEFKSAAGGFPGSFWDTYSAFANTDGGTIILGVAEKNGRFHLDSLTDEQINKYQKDFWNNVNNKSTISCNLLRSDDLKVVEYKGHKIMTFYIPKAHREQRPVYRTTQPYNGTFKRNFEGDYKCTQREVQRMFADADVSRPADSRILKNYSLDDIDKASLQQYRQLFSIAKPDHPWLALTDLDLLKKLGGYRRDRETNEEGFTVAGLLMFGKTEAITDNACVPDFFPDYQEKLSDDPNVRWTNRICPDGTWEANLFQFYRLVLPRLQAVLPKPFILEDNIRKDETPAHIAIREAFINFCIHTDYSENATMTIRLFKTKLEFSNPGTLLVSKQQYYQGGDSVCRNKALQTMFMLLGSAEKAGSGVDKILQGWKESNWKAPVLVTKSQPDKVELTLHMESLMDDDVKAHLSIIFGEKILNIEHNKLLILTIACTDGYVTNERIRFAVPLHKTDITQLLKKMCQENLLIPEGHGRGTRYRLPSENNGQTDPKVASSGKKGCNLTDPKVASSDEKGCNLTGSKVASSDKKGCNLKGEGITSFTKRRMNREELFWTITQTCSDWKSLDEIAKAVNRDYNYLRNKILPKMLTEGMLEMMFPGIPNHPNQKYKKKE